MRKKVFGDKAYLPMTQEGAMEDSLDTLNKGIITHHGHDQHGRAVFHIWRTQMHSGVASRNDNVRQRLFCVLLLCVCMISCYLFALTLTDPPPL